MMNNPDIRTRINAFLSTIAQITESEIKIFHFDGELFHPNVGKPVFIYDLNDIRLVDEELVVDKVCVGPMTLDGSPDFRYRSHSWRQEVLQGCHLIHGDGKATWIQLGPAASEGEIRTAAKSLSRLATSLKNHNFAEVIAITAGIVALTKRLESLRPMIQDAVLSYAYLDDVNKGKVEEAPSKEALMQADYEVQLTRVALLESQTAASTKQLRSQFEAPADAVREEEAKRRVAAITDLIAKDQ